MRESTVEWIAQPATGRYAARWLESSGQIRLASWHSRAPGPVSYQYRQRRWDEGREVAGPGDRSPAVFFAATSVLQTAAFEDDLFEWVQALTRQRSPLARFVDWGARPGVVVVSTTNAGATFTCMRYEDRRGSFEDCVRTNPGSAVVLEETIRIVSASHELLVRIPWSEVETGPEAIAAIASFLPPGLDLLDRDYASLLAPRPTASPSPVALAALPRAMLDAEEAVEQIRLRGGPGMILHLSSSAGLIRVSGRVSTSEQLLWVTRTLEQALPSAALQVDLQSEQDTPLPPLAESQTPTIAGQTAPRALPYVQRAFPQWSPSDLREYCNRALRLSSQIVAESAILADMAQRYPPEIESLLTLQDQERLRLLQRSRAARMAANAGVLQTHLAAIAGLAASSVPDPALDVKGRPSWQRQALAHATQAGHLHSRLLSLFAVSTEFSSDIPVARPDDGMLFSPLLRHLESLASERADSASAPSARAQ
ncbi:MAG: hypothetical protein U5J83_01280 [Bryobacterales bacterium]|nr:hypothetical protein [Bryobacterales bacterium]